MAFTTHEEYIASNKSEKIILGHIHASKRLYNFLSDSGLFARVTTEFVNKVFLGTTELTRVVNTGAVTDATKFYYDVTTSKLYLYEFDQDNDEIIVEYRFFFSNVPINLAWDLGSGAEVEYEPRIVKVPKFKSQMSQGKKGINLVGKGNFQINNNDGKYDSVYDTVFFENKDANIYTFNRDLAVSEAQIIFRGTITGKHLDTKAIVFTLNDSLYALDELVPTVQYGTDVIDEDSNNHKRIIYGQADNLQVQSLDKYGSGGIVITGTFTGITGTDYIVGTGTNFLNDLSDGDVLKFSDFEVTVNQVKTNTVIKVNELDRTFNNRDATLIPEIQYNNRNREFQVAGHAIKKSTTTIDTIISRNRIILTDVTGFKADDIIDFDGEEKTIRRISGNTMVLSTNFNLPHSAGDPVTKKELFNIRYDKDTNLIDSADVTITNTSAGTTFTIGSNTEINTAPTVRLAQPIRWLDGFAGAWVGVPHVVNINIVSGPMYEKYFILYDTEGESTAYWFKDTAPVEVSDFKEPNHGADNSTPISLTVSNPDTNTLVEAVFEAIARTQDNYQVRFLGSNVTITSINPEPITNPNVGTTSFGTTVLYAGSANDYKIDLKDILNPRDYVVGPDGFSYEILQVYEKSLTLRTNFGGPFDATIGLSYKNIEYINDETVVYLDCFGKTKDGEPTGELIETSPEVVKDIIDSVGLGQFVDTASFIDASIRAPQVMSLVIPEKLASQPDSAKEVVNKINKTILGSLYVNPSLDLGYDILDSEVPIDTLRSITESDLISWKVKADSFDLTKTSIARYKFIDWNPTKKSEDTSEVSYTSNFVEKYIGNKNTKQLDFYLYNQVDAQEMVERETFVNSVSNSTIKIKGKLNLSKFQLGERVLLDLDRLYVALGSSSNSKRVGIVTSLENTGESVQLQIEDIGAVYTRASRITNETANDYVDASGEERVTNSYIVDENEIIGTDEDTFSTNLIG